MANDHTTWISTRSLSLDLALGGKGLPTGIIVDLYGREGTCKTTLCLNLAAEFQRLGHRVGFVDADHKLTAASVRRCGVDASKLQYQRPASLQAALGFVEHWLEKDFVKLVVIDSLPALPVQMEVGSPLGHESGGMQNSLVLSRALPKLIKITSDAGAIVLFVNQVRFREDFLFGNPEVPTGCRALRDFASVRLETRCIKRVKNANDVVIGDRLKVTVHKNAFSQSHKTAEIDVLYEAGFCSTNELIEP